MLLSLSQHLSLSLVSPIPLEFCKSPRQVRSTIFCPLVLSTTERWYGFRVINSVDGRLTHSAGCLAHTRTQWLVIGSMGSRAIWFIGLNQTHLSYLCIKCMCVINFHAGHRLVLCIANCRTGQGVGGSVHYVVSIWTSEMFAFALEQSTFSSITSMQYAIRTGQYDVDRSVG